MAIEQVKDPRTRKMVTFVSGKVDGVFFNELKQIKTYTHEGKQWTPTHSATIVVDGTRIQFGLTDKQKINGKDTEGNYQEVLPGCEVSVEITEVGEYNGKPTYNSKASRVTVLDISGARQPQQNNSGGNNPSYQKKDDTPIVAGNARTAAATWLSRFDCEESFQDLIRVFAEQSHKARQAVTDAHSDLSAYEVGVGVGQATVAAAMLSDDLAEVYDFIMNYVENDIPFSIDVVKEFTAEKKETKTSAKKTTKKAPKKEATAERVDDNNIPEEAFDDSDIPF